MIVMVTPTSPLGSVYADYMWNGYVSGPNTFAIHICNGTGVSEAGATAQTFVVRPLQ
jgi:hypothetical protein